MKYLKIFKICQGNEKWRKTRKLLQAGETDMTLNSVWYLGWDPETESAHSVGNWVKSEWSVEFS